MGRRKKIIPPKCNYKCIYHGLHYFPIEQIKYNIKKGFPVYCKNSNKCINVKLGFPQWCILNEEERSNL